ncbi:MAG: sensor histidine kinase [Myxococcales bacterium]
MRRPLSLPGPPAREADIDLRRPASIAIAAVLIGTAALLGAWLLGSPSTAAVLSHTMKANTALALAAVAASLLLQLRGRAGAGRALALVALSIGALTLFEYATGVDLGIDQILALDATNEESLLHPGRMAPNAAMGLLLLGGALATCAPESQAWRRLAGAAVLTVSVLSLFALVGYLYGAKSFYKIPNAIRLSQYTAASLFVLSIAALAIWPRGTFTEVLVSRTPGGLVARRALVPVVVLPILLGFLRNAGERAGLFGDSMGTAMMASATVLALGFVVWQSARVLDRKDAAQRALAAENERLAREAQEAVRVRDEFIAIAAHELRTPLTSLRLQTQLDARRADPDGRERRDVYVRQIDRLTRLVDGMLDSARIASGALQLDRSTVDLSTLAKQVVDDLRDQFAATGTTASLRVRPGVLVEGDPLRLAQVAENLLSNALKYGGGKPIEIAVEQSGGRAVLSVSDRGIGIDASDQQRIFGLFERAVPASNFGGLGLGLYFAHQVVAAHGGRIDVRSEPGHGAIFAVSLPALAQASP